MSYNAEGIRQIAMINKRSLKQKFFIVPSGGEEYKFKISGIGSRFIKIEKFFYYSDIINAVTGGNDRSFEYAIEQIIVDPSKNKKPVLEDYNELRERALANKLNLKKYYINVFIGKKEYGFKIAGIGNKSVKIELYVGYDEIVKELSSGNDISLEFILLEIMMGNEVDYSKFNQLYDEDDLIFNEDEDLLDDSVDEESTEEINIDNIEKLSDEEFDELFSNLKGWNKLVFDAIEDTLSETFTLDLLLSQKRILSYKSRGDDLEEKVLDNLNQLIDLGLVSKINKNTYVKLWV
ncbi:hypothetical protein [Methanobrevibacter sp. UBA212]|uniref:hypothetical protein n=1 Tax=Methanobrevibacter sp. UBA212 TaxID=1915476 RepID=UPI0025F06246|nr:hypothetical protein [Methanobrevibacter sp. UBA212]